MFLSRHVLFESLLLLIVLFVGCFPDQVAGEHARIGFDDDAFAIPATQAGDRAVRPEQARCPFEEHLADRNAEEFLRADRARGLIDRPLIMVRFSLLANLDPVPVSQRLAGSSPAGGANLKGLSSSPEP
jgi:hypothetical protein